MVSGSLTQRFKTVSGIQLPAFWLVFSRSTMPTNQSLVFCFYGSFGVQSGFGHRDLGPSVLEVFHRALSADVFSRWRHFAGATDFDGLGGDLLNWHAQCSAVWEPFDVGDGIVYPNTM